MRTHPRRARIVASLLAGIAGFTDAVGFLSLGGFFVSFMSGNSTRLGSAMALGGPEAAVAAALIVAFVAGVALGTRLHASRPRWSGAVVAALLAAAGLAHDHGMVPSMALAAMAMGALNTWSVSGSPLPVGLTYMTGTLVRVGQYLGHPAAGAWRDAAPYLLHWLALVLGAVAGTWAYMVLAHAALFLAAALVAALAWLVRRSG